MGRTHGGGPAVGQKVDEHFIGGDHEGVVVSPLQNLFPLGFGGEADRLHTLYAKGFDDGFHPWAPGTIWGNMGWRKIPLSDLFCNAARRKAAPEQEVFMLTIEGSLDTL